MNYYFAIFQKIEEFCKAEPAPDERIAYLEKAAKIKELYFDSLILQENGVQETGKEIEEIYQEIAKLVD